MTKLAPLLAALVMSACATVKGYYDNPLPVDTSPQAVVSAKPCSALPIDHFANVNPTQGWSDKKVPAGMTELSCGGSASKYAYGPYYCAKKESCPQPLFWGTHPDPNITKMKGSEATFILDLLAGSVNACAEQANRFGVGGLDCKRQMYTATRDKPLRIAVPVQVLGQAQTSGDVRLVIEAASDGIVVGQVGTAQVMN